MADNLVYEESLNTEIETSEFISKKWVYVNDNNNGNYTSQIVIDSTPLSNAGGYISWQEGFILMPLLVQLTSGTAGSLPNAPPTYTTKGNFAWAFKSGFWNLINSMTVEFNNQNVIQQTPFLNVFRSFKSNTSYSLDDLLNVGPTTGFYPDNPNSWGYSNNFAQAVGGGTPKIQAADGANTPYANNRNTSLSTVNTTTPLGFVAPPDAAIPSLYAYLPSTGISGQPVLTTGTGGAGPPATNWTLTYSGASSNSTLVGNPNSFNEGMAKRQSWYNYQPSNSQGEGLVNSATSCQKVLRSFCDDNLNQVDGSVSWQVYAKLRLKDLADFFEKMPLLKGSTIRFYLNTNQSIVNFTTTPTQIIKTTAVLDVAGTLTINSVNTIGGLTNPLMVSSLRPPCGSSALATDTYNLSVSIFKNNFSAQSALAQQTTLPSCRLYAPVYYMNPLAESKYLSLAPTKKIMYKDVFQYQFNGQGSGNFNFLVSNGISNICSVLVVPFISKNNAYTNVAGAAIAQSPYDSYQSPTCPCPGMPDPITLSDFNILISGVNLFLNNNQYDFESFLEQLNQSNQINGGLTTGLASGLINESAFSSGYRYYYGDCSRILPSEQGVSRSVQIVGNNVSSVNINIMVFVEFMREITIDISTGARIE
jgi:hypothetical protein